MLQPRTEWSASIRGTSAPAARIVGVVDARASPVPARSRVVDTLSGLPFGVGLETMLQPLPVSCSMQRRWAGGTAAVGVAHRPAVGGTCAGHPGQHAPVRRAGWGRRAVSRSPVYRSMTVPDASESRRPSRSAAAGAGHRVEADVAAARGRGAGHVVPAAAGVLLDQGCWPPLPSVEKPVPSTAAPAQVTLQLARPAAGGAGACAMAEAAARVCSISACSLPPPATLEEPTAQQSLAPAHATRVQIGGLRPGGMDGGELPRDGTPASRSARRWAARRWGCRRRGARGGEPDRSAPRR